MSQDTWDMIVGAAILIPFLILVFAAGLVLNKFKNGRFVKAWAPLAPIINGTVTNDGGGAATSWLTGTYRRRKVRASMAPGRNRYSGESGHTYNYFDIEIQDVSGRQDWSVVYKTSLPGFGQTGWGVETKDKSLEESLRGAGVVDMVARLGGPTVEYKVKQGTLLYSEDVTPRWVPTPERFQEELELLLRLAEVNEAINPA
ncbi:MAG: hypothetical protein KDI79_17150 [Anaerolineae bacterium]|nr:hypothetical protein [Anaerolineae bacterium]